MMSHEDERVIFDVVAPLLALKQDIEMRAWLRPSAIMLPTEAVPGLTTLYGIPVIHGDRAALLYSPPQPIEPNPKENE